MAKDFHKISGQGVKDSQKSSGQVAKDPEKSSDRQTKHFQKSSVQGCKDAQKSFGQLEKISHKSLGKVATDPQKSSGQMAKDYHKSSGQVVKNPQNNSGQVAKDPQKTSGLLAKDSQKSCGQMDKAPQEAQLPTEHSCLKPPVHSKEALPRKTLGIKRPGQPLVIHEPKRVQKVESEPGPLKVTDQPSKVQPKVIETVKPKASDSKDPKPALHEPSEKTKDKGSQQANAEGFLDLKLLRDAQEYDALILSGHRPGDLHKEKVPLPPGEKKLSSPARKPGLKRKAGKSPEESPGKKKREDKGETPRKKKE